jgi:hypothetical protein
LCPALMRLAQDRHDEHGSAFDGRPMDRRASKKERDTSFSLLDNNL